MKTRLTLILGLLISGCCLPALAQGTAFTYQGRLDTTNGPAHGTYDLRFAIYDLGSGGAQQGGAVTNTATAVSNGLFTVTLDFGNQFPGADRWLEIGVRTNGGGAFTPLTPRQQLTATPYAVTAGIVTGLVPAGQIAGTLSESQLPAVLLTNNQTGVGLTGTFLGGFTGDGAGLTNLNAWRLGGNAGTTPGVNFLGTTDNQPVEVRVNHQRALRLEPNSGGAPNVIAGASVNLVSPGVLGATISGGGATNVFGQAFTNRVLANWGTVGGGWANTAGGESAAVGGGSANLAACRT